MAQLPDDGFGEPTSPNFRLRLVALAAVLLLAVGAVFLSDVIAGRWSRAVGPRSTTPVRPASAAEELVPAVAPRKAAGLARAEVRG